MGKLSSATRWLFLIASMLVILPLSCKGQSTPTPPAEYSVPELEYRLISNFDNIFWCDPDIYPVARQGQEQKNALEQFPTIKANAAEFSAILQHLGMANKAEYTDEEKLAIYREHKKLTYTIQIASSGGLYSFTLRVGQNQGERINGTITPSGEIKVLKREPSINTCPICLAKGTLIDTPSGPVPVEQIRTGATVWIIDVSGKSVPAVVLETAMTPVPASFRLLRVRLSDGRAVTASPLHPTAEGKPLSDYQAGDMLDGALVASVESIPYDGGATYDFLPSGGTGLYRADSILLKSTLAKN